jgi:phosphate transport system substrate-binding protein
MVSTKIIVAVIVIAAGMMLAGVGIGYAAWGTTNQVTPPPSTITLTISGSTTEYPIVADAATQFEALYPNYDVQVSQGGSSVGVSNVEANVSDIAMSSSALGASDYAKDAKLNATIVARDGIAIILNAELATAGNFSSLNFTATWIKMIYNGSWTNWNQVPTWTGSAGGHAIDVNSREYGSGTRASFEKFVMNNTITGNGVCSYVAGMVVDQGSPALNTSVCGDPWAIGYIGVGFVTTHVTAVLVNAATVAAQNHGGAGVGPFYACTVANVLTMTYPLSRYLYMITNGPRTLPELNFINFMVGPVGQQCVIEQGFVSILANPNPPGEFP